LLQMSPFILASSQHFDAWMFFLPSLHSLFPNTYRTYSPTTLNTLNQRSFSLCDFL
jgi:hypothetical protein